MCVIVYLKKNKIIPQGMLKNACHNNWHSSGLIVHKGNTLEITKEVPESGELDSDKIYELLQQNKEFDRVLHLRHNTAGATDMRNAHPMTVYKDENRHVEFMHNGTFYTYKSKKYDVNKKCEVDDDDGPSDTRNFVDRVLSPYLSSMDFGNGKADIEHFLTKQFIKQFWTGENRGILISNDQAPLLVGEWKTLGSGENEIIASNNQYFDAVTRGPELDRRLVRQREEEAARKGNKKKGASAREAGSRELASLKDFAFDQTHPFYKLSESPCSIVNDWDFYDREHCVTLGLMTRPEYAQLYEDRAACIDVMDYAFTDYAKLYNEYIELEEKQMKSTKIIATLVGRIQKHEPEFKING